MATVDDLVDEVDDYGFTHLSDARKISLLNQAYQYINSYEAWPFLNQNDTTVDYTDISVTLPTDFGRVITMFTDVATAGGDYKVEYMKHADINDYIVDRDHSSSPRTETRARYYYYIGDPQQSATSLKVYPGLGSGISGTLRVLYTRVAADLVAAGAESTILLPARHHAALRYGLLHECFLMERDLGMADHFRQLRDDKIRMMQRDLLEENFDQDFITVPQDSYYLDHNHF